MGRDRAGARLGLVLMMGSSLACMGDVPGATVANREAALLHAVAVDERRVSAAAERLEMALAAVEPSARLDARAERLDAEVAALRSDEGLDLATLRVTAAAIRARFYDDVSEEEVGGRPGWEPTDDDRRNAATLATDLAARRPTAPPDPSLLTPDGLAGEAVAPPSLEELMAGPRPRDSEVSATEEAPHAY